MLNSSGVLLVITSDPSPPDSVVSLDDGPEVIFPLSDVDPVDVCPVPPPDEDVCVDPPPDEVVGVDPPALAVVSL